MINTKFEAYKIGRELKRSGRNFTFLRPALNEFGEPIKNQLNVVGSIIGLYHEVNSYVEITSGQGQYNVTQTRSKKKPMILCLYEDVIPLELKVGDRIEINSNTFRVVNISNVQEWNIIADISLEVIEVGSEA